MIKNSTLAAAIHVVGVHSYPKSKDGEEVTSLGKPYWQSENNQIDGGMYPDAKYDAALAW
eukprot:TRINITY_DN4943_c0_g1_i1.p2 TRINITY_DN4943_c0_g1~~TRINITY_DN4943_c0_g1_i1.p2  ORF type:complete len:60 (+),score=19.36 TRINITY_DN4943_c0_g1_i1:163-342(+)